MYLVWVSSRACDSRERRESRAFPSRTKKNSWKKSFYQFLQKMKTFSFSPSRFFRDENFFLERCESSTKVWKGRKKMNNHVPLFMYRSVGLLTCLGYDSGSASHRASFVLKSDILDRRWWACGESRVAANSFLRRLLHLGNRRPGRVRCRVTKGPIRKRRNRELQKGKSCKVNRKVKKRVNAINSLTSGLKERQRIDDGEPS